MYQVLDVDLSFKYEDLRVFIPVVGSLLAFIIFWFTWMSEKFQKKNLNIEAAYLHILGDLLNSIGVIIAAVIIFFFP